MGNVGVWKRLKRQGVELRSVGTKKGNHWAMEKRGEEYISGGRVWIRGHSSSENKNSQRRAVLVMERVLGGPIPKGYHVHHEDFNSLNDDPFNLELVTSAEHTRIHHFGKRNPKKASRKTNDNTEEIIRLYSSGKYTQNQLGEKFGLHQTTIGHIILKERSKY